VPLRTQSPSVRGNLFIWPEELLINGVGDGDEIVEFGRLGEASGGAELQGLPAVKFLAGTREDDGGRSVEFGVVADEGEDVKATRAQHPVIEEEEVGEAMDGAVGKGSLALEILDGLFTALEVDEVVGQSGLEKSDAQEEEIIGGILGDEDIFHFKGRGLGGGESVNECGMRADARGRRLQQGKGRHMG
jgi:hypothetical protein